MELVSKLGLNLTGFLGQLLNFAVVLFVLHRFVYRPLLKVLDDRRMTIEESLKNVEIANTKTQHAEEEAKKIVQEARTRASEIIHDAEARGIVEKTKLIDAATREVATLLANAEQESIKIKQNALKSAEKELGSIVLMATEKVLTGVAGVQIQQSLVDDALKSVQKQL